MPIDDTVINQHQWNIHSLVCSSCEWPATNFSYFLKHHSPSFKGLQWGNARQMFFSHVASLLFVGKIHDESSRGPWRNLLVFYTLTDFQYFLFVLRQSDCRLTANIRYWCCHESKQASCGWNCATSCCCNWKLFERFQANYVWFIKTWTLWHFILLSLNFFSFFHLQNDAVVSRRQRRSHQLAHRQSRTMWTMSAIDQLMMAKLL